MSYDPIAHRENVKVWLLKLVREGGRGWHDYAKDKAKRLADEDHGLHGDLPRAVEAAMAEAAPPRATTTTTRRP